MWHPVVNVAKSQKLDEKKLANFALQNLNKYSIVTNLGYPEVSTWYVNKLVDDFRRKNKKEKKT